MKYQKPFRVHDNTTKIYLRVSIIKDFLQGMNLTKISKKENCAIKAIKIGLMIIKRIYTQKEKL